MRGGIVRGQKKGKDVLRSNGRKEMRVGEKQSAGKGRERMRELNGAIVRRKKADRLRGTQIDRHGD